MVKLSTKYLFQLTFSAGRTLITTVSLLLYVVSQWNVKNAPHPNRSAVFAIEKKMPYRRVLHDHSGRSADEALRLLRETMKDYGPSRAKSFNWYRRLDNGDSATGGTPVPAGERGVRRYTAVRRLKSQSQRKKDGS